MIKKYISLIDALSRFSGKVAAWLSTVLVLVICTDVLLRYAFNFSSVAFFETEWHLFALIFLLGASYTLQADRHVRVDVFYTKFTEKQKAWVNFLGCVCFLFPFCLIVIKAGIPYVEISFNLQEKSTDPGGLPYRYLIKSSIVIGFVLLLLQGTVFMLSSLSILLSEKKP